jgi:hypothetical protein
MPRSEYLNLQELKKVDAEVLMNQKELFDFGDFDKILKLKRKKSFLENKKKNNALFSEYSVIQVDKSALLEIISIFHEQVLSIKEKELKDLTKIIDGKASTYESDKLKRSFTHSRNEWTATNGYLPYSIKGDELVSSWVFEYAIFELVYIFKTFDFNENVLYLIQW